MLLSRCCRSSGRAGLAAQLPEPGGGALKLEPAEAQEISLKLVPGKPFTAAEPAKWRDAAIRISGFADGILIGGMTSSHRKARARAKEVGAGALNHLPREPPSDRRAAPANVSEHAAFWLNQAAGVGFEPTGDLSAASGFQDRPIRPLWHPAG